MSTRDIHIISLLGNCSFFRLQFAGECGQVYSWEVAARKNEQKIVTPAPPAPEARFKILEQKVAVELDKALDKNPHSHFVSGVLLAGAGLLNEAEAEFQSLVKATPRSIAARKMLNDIRSKRNSQHRRK